MIRIFSSNYIHDTYHFYTLKIFIYSLAYSTSTAVYIHGKRIVQLTTSSTLRGKAILYLYRSKAVYKKYPVKQEGRQFGFQKQQIVSREVTRQ